KWGSGLLVLSSFRARLRGLWTLPVPLRLADDHWLLVHRIWCNRPASHYRHRGKWHDGKLGASLVEPDRTKWRPGPWNAHFRPWPAGRTLRPELELEAPASVRPDP